MPTDPPPKAPTQAVALFGESRMPQAPTGLAWDSWTAQLESALLRNIRCQDLEIIRGLEFVARDENWGTLGPNATITAQHPGRPDLRGTFEFHDGPVSWKVGIEFQPDGLTITGRAEATSKVRTNRTGFVLLHPLSCLGQDLEIEHADGTISQVCFPTLIRPDQPAMDIRALRYAPADNLWLELHFEGDTFEMEDQRNWLDASFKTYCRPHSLPKPYTLAPGKPIEQRITVRLERRPTQVRVIEAGQPGECARVPSIGLGVPIDTPLPRQTEQALLAHLAPAFLLIEDDAAQLRSDLDNWRHTANAIGAGAALDLWCSDANCAAKQIKALCARIAETQPAWLAIDHTPGDLSTLVERLRHDHPELPLGAGTRAFFTELNRDRPAADGSSAGDFIRWTMTPTVHAMDDASVMQSLDTTPWSVRTADSFASGRSMLVGPQTLRMRFNPEQVTQGPTRDEGVPPDIDPRQRGLFGAAWLVGHVAGLLHERVDRVAFFEPIGPRGVIYREAGFSQPWFDELQTCELQTPAAYPLFVVLESLMRAQDRAAKAVRLGARGEVRGIELLDGNGPCWIIANTSPKPVTLPECAQRWSMLDANTMPDACMNPVGFWKRHAQSASTKTQLGAHAVAIGWGR